MSLRYKPALRCRFYIDLLLIMPYNILTYIMFR